MNLKTGTKFCGYLTGIILCGLFILNRVPGLYNGLWEDPVHYNSAFLEIQNFHQLMDRIAPIMRPLLDYAIRKWVWFSAFGFPVSEKHLALVALIYSGVHFLCFMLFPWTRYMSLRILACLMLGFNAVETTYATEAQGYSFYSLAPTLFLFAFLEATSRLLQNKLRPAVTIFLAGWALVLNSHFFAWPMAFVILAFFTVYLWKMTSGPERTYSFVTLSLGSGLVLFITYWINKNPLLFLLQHPPSLRLEAPHLLWKDLWAYVARAWEWDHINVFLYLAALASGWFHPERSKRYLSYALTLIVIVVKFLLVAAMTWRSSYGIADRYLIMFIGPSILGMLIGLESLALYLEHCRRYAGAAFSTMCLLSACWVWRVKLLRLPQEASTAITQWTSTPPNYSRNFEFFQRVKSENRPTLILTNHCWASDIPTLYMRYIQPAVSAPLTVLNVAGCETPDSTRRAGIDSYMRQYEATGAVVFFYEQLDGRPNPCRTNLKSLYRVVDTKTCLSIYYANSMDGFLAHEVRR